MLVDDPNNKQINKPDVACVIGDMKRLWRSLEGQEDVGVVGGGGAINSAAAAAVIE